MDLTRRSFSKLGGAIALSTPAVLRAQSNQRVAVIGAGAAGLTAAYHLTKAGVDTVVLEAADVWGGRLKRDTSLADVPLDLGAEWIHEEPSVLGRILGDGPSDLGIATLEYRPQSYQFWNDGKLRNFNALRHAYAEVKFSDTTWFGFFERFVLPSVVDRIETGAAAKHISGRATGVDIHLADGRTIDADKVVLTVPLSVLQQDKITFSSGLNAQQLKHAKDITFGHGFKVFMKFAERFYPDVLDFGSRLSVLDDTWDEKIYYDAAFEKPTTQNVLGLFTVSQNPLERAALNDADLVEDVLRELTTIFGEVVRSSFQGSVVQNWSNRAHILGSYSMDNDSDFDVEDIFAPIDGKVFFAGEMLGGDYQSTVHGAAFSAQSVVNEILDRA